MQNFRFTTPAAALRVRRKDLRLVQCRRCGLVFNSRFDPDLIPYNANYENRQCFSPVFQTHMQSLVDELIARHGLRGKNLLEVGCGKGDFLKLLCQRAHAQGVGFDTSFEGDCEPHQGPVRFCRQYVTARDIAARFDLVICRHVVEHVPHIGDFLQNLRSVAQACGNPVTFIETPAFEWIAEHHCFFDIFFEHCNYFTRPGLAWLCEQAGFEVARQGLTFGGQYQVLELKLRRTPNPAGGAAPVIPVRLSDFARRAEARLSALEQKLLRAGARQGWAIFGAGAKGVALVNRLRQVPPRFVIDSNHAKQACVIPGSRVPVVAPDDPRIRELVLVLIANPNYAEEITFGLRKMGYAHSILVA